jgi:hypothetical protein
MMCQTISVKAGVDANDPDGGFTPVEIECRNEATHVTEDGCRCCSECAALFLGEGFAVSAIAKETP